MTQQDDDLQGCEHCDKEYPIEDMMMMGDCWICQPCIAEWRTIFKSCDHQWVPDIDHMGDDGQCCTKCSGFVANENFTALFGEPAQTSEMRSGEQ